MINKGPHLTARFNLYEKYVLLKPFCNIVLISHKVSDINERLRFYSLDVLIRS